MKVKLKPQINSINTDASHLEFLNTGLACHALCLLEQAGILSQIKERNYSLDKINESKNPYLLRAVLMTLVGAKVLKLEQETFKLTNLGISLVEHIGAITLPILGYRELIAKQYQLLEDPEGWHDSEIDYEAIAVSSINFGIRYLDPLLMTVIKHLQPKGTICSLGCGTAEKLVKICKEVNVSGLGIEKCTRVIKKSQSFIRDTPEVEVIQADIRELNGVWEDVELGIISFVLHDINPEQDSIKLINSLEKHFPKMKCLIVVDIVSMSVGETTIMPGFDYVHGLQGVTPRTHQETLQLFSKSNFKLLEEMPVPNMPNTFIWILGTKTQSRKEQCQ